MAEQSPQTFTQADVQAAIKIATIEKDVTYIKEALTRLERAVADTNIAMAGTNQTIQSIVHTAVSENNKKNELMISGLMSRVEVLFAAQEKVTNVQAAAAAEKLQTLMPWRDKMLQWSGVVVFLTGAIAVILWLLNRYAPVARP